MMLPPSVLDLRSPQGGNAVVANTGIVRQEHESLRKRLCDQHPVEGIAMDCAQSRVRIQVSLQDRQSSYKILFPQPCCEYLRGDRESQLSQLRLDHDLPQGCHAVVDLAVRPGERLRGSLGQFVRIDSPPNVGVGVNEE